MHLVFDGFVLLLLGQLVVFAFILTMIGVIRAVDLALRRLLPAEPQAEPASVPVDAADDGGAVAAALAAVHAHRSKC